MAGKKSDLGPTGVDVTHNVRRLREAQRLSYAELSRQLGEGGREIPPLGLRRIESGARRVDADDLVALAVALEVSPATLLGPPVKDPDKWVEVTGVENPVQARRVWDWLIARDVLVPDYSDALLAFYQRAMPVWELGSVAEQYRLFLKQVRDEREEDSRHGDD